MATSHSKILILVSGPAGLTAAIYASRANLKPLCIEGWQAGGQLMITTDVENYPGFPEGVTGPELMKLFRDQAERFGTTFVTADATKVDFSQRPFKIWVEEDATEPTGSNYSQIPRPIPTDNPDPTVVYPVSDGGAIDVAAPGVNILTTAKRTEGEEVSHNYAFQTGTSFSAPHVVGLVALYIAANGRAHDEKGVYRIRQAIINESQRLQPQTRWANNAEDPDDNHEALAYPSEEWVPKPKLSLVRNSVNTVLTATTAGTDTFDSLPRSIPGYQYAFQYRDGLIDPSWTDIASMSGDGDLLQATDTAPETGMRFYRVKISAAP